MKKIQRPMVIGGEEMIITKFRLHGTTFKISDKSLCNGWQTRKNAPIVRSLHVCDINEVQKSKKINGL